MRVPPVRYPILPAKGCHTKQYNKFRGVDFSTDPAMIDGSRSPNAINLVSDSGGYPEKRIGWEVLAIKMDEQVNGLYHLVNNGGTYMIAHCGGTLYAWAGCDFSAPGVVLTNAMHDGKSAGFVHEGKLYILDGARYWVCDGETAGEVAGFTPTTVIGRAPAGGGTPLEPVNLISLRRKNSFVGDGGTAEVARLQISAKATANGNVTVTLGGTAVATAVQTSDAVAGIAVKIAASAYSGWTAQAVGDTVTFTSAAVGVKSDAVFSPGTTGVLGNIITLTQGAAAVAGYQLDAAGLDAAAVTVVVAGVEKTETTHFTVNRATGVVTFAAGHIPPSGNGVDNVVITFSKTVDGYAERIKKCTMATWFGMGNDSRVFVSGNPEFQNLDWQSGLYDPTYFPDTGYTKVGADSSAIMGYLRQYDNQLIIKEDNEQDATIYMRTAELDGEGNAVFPLKQGVAGIGAASRHAFATLRDDPLFLAKEGVFAPTLAFGSVGQQRVTQNRSYFVNARLIREPNLDTAVSAVWNGLYLLAVNGRCYVADGRQKTGKSDTESFGYEWFYWTNLPARVFLEKGGELYFGDVDGRICRFMTGVDANTRFSDDGEPIVAVWTSKLDDEGDFMRYKELPRKGTGVLVKPYSRSSIDVYVRTDVDPTRLVRSSLMDVFDWGDIDFEHFDFNTMDSPYIIPLNTRVYRYKSIQVLIKNDALNEGFGCFGIIKRFIVGNYVK